MIEIEINNKKLNFNNNDEFKSYLQSHYLKVDDNGNIFKEEGVGVVPSILTQWFSERVEYRKLAGEYGKAGDKEKEAFYDRRQKRQKIFLNSVYGVLGLPIFRFYDRDNAEATTISGQTIIHAAERLVNKIYTDRLQAKGVSVTDTDFVKYIDTDSIYVSALPMAQLEDKYPEMTQFTIDLATDISKNINRMYEYMVPRIFNVSPEKNRIKIVPDVIAKKALWVAKKRYAMLKVFDMEKMRPVKDKKGNEGKLEVKGIDTVRSSFPAAFRKFAGEILDLLLRGTNREILDEKIMAFEETINDHSVINLAKTSSANFISRSGEENYNPKGRKVFQFVKGTPSQVKAALAYNDFLKVWELDKQVIPITTGSKIKWIYLLPNSFCITQLAMKADDTDPDKILEFIETNIDRKTIYQRELYSKLEEVYRCVGWQMPNRGSQLAAKTFDFQETW